MRTRLGMVIAPGQMEEALALTEPVRSTAFGRNLVRHVLARGDEARYVRMAEPLRVRTYDVDHCLPISMAVRGPPGSLARAATHERPRQT